MAFNETELAIIKTGKESGKSRQQVEEALQNYRLGITPSKKERVQNQFVDGRKSPLRALGDVSLGAVKGLTETAIALPRALQAGGQAVHAGLDPTRTFAEVREQTGLASLQGDDAAFIDDLLKAKNPEQRAGKIIAFAGELLAGGGASLLKKGFQKGTEAVGGVVGRGKTAISEALPSGLKQTVSEFGERIPRLGGRVRERVEQASVRAERIRNATPATQKAIKSGVDDRIIDFVDDVKLNAPDTLSDYKEIVDLAENVGARGAARPEFIAGQRAAEQYKLADKARKDVGGKIGEAVDALSKKQGAVNILPAQRNLRILLSQNGIQPTKGGKLVFEATEYTPAQQKKIQELYDIATKSENFTARQIWGFDKQFSQLQRTARFDSEIGDIFIKTADGGDTSIFKAFRDVYSGELENIAPEIRVLNREYAQWRTLIDDVESSIVKRGNFSGTSKVDPAEFAQTNLRRIFSDATSAADYRAIYNNLDEASRTLGYTGSRADDLAWFATRMRQIFPETVPETSATKILGGGVKQTTEKVLEAGKPSLVDQQRAIREMLEEALGQGSFKQGVIPINSVV